MTVIGHDGYKRMPFASFTGCWLVLPSGCWANCHSWHKADDGLKGNASWEYMTPSFSPD